MTEASVATTAATTPAIRLAGQDDVRRIGEVLTDAFYHDPVFGWCIPDAARRAQSLPAFFQLFATALVPKGAVYVAQDGAALWAPPGESVVAEDEVEAFYGQMAEICGSDMERVGAVGKMIDARHPQGDFHYLQLIGVSSALRGKGIGSALLREVLATADEQGVPAYLEATSPLNKKLYERHGFIAQEPFSPEGCPPLWPMWRAPQK